MITSYSWGSFWLLFSMTVLILCYLAVEYIRHNIRIKSIPIRIHVNGSRGKSSITRLIAAGLRACGIVTCAKTTGTIPRFIHVDGTEETIYRPAPSNILEQLKFIKQAAHYKSQAIVVECMALQPILQSLCELKMIKSTHGVITNIKPDHLDVMGPMETDVAWAMSGTVPVSGSLFTAEQKHFKRLAFAAKDRKSSIELIEENYVSDKEMLPFSYYEHKINVALALKVCENLGAKRSVALRGMWNTVPDIGALTTMKINNNGKPLIFANGFAANDPTSSEKIWHLLLEQHYDCKTKIIIINCRSDRNERSLQFIESMQSWTQPNIIYAAGTGAAVFYRLAKKTFPESTQIIDASKWDRKDILNSINSTTLPTPFLVVGLGNIAGIGIEIVEYSRRYCSVKEN